MHYICTMRLEDAKMEFIHSWGVVGSAWGIPRSMAQIHALLLTNENGLSAEDVMEQIQLSRGNVNTNLRELINWGLIAKQNKLGERKEFFRANHDVHHIAQSILTERKKREFIPIQDLLRKLKDADIKGPKDEVKHFEKLVAEFEDFISHLDQLSNLMTKMNENRFFKKMIKAMG